MCDTSQLLLGCKLQATNAKATRKQEKVLSPKSLFVPDNQNLFHVTDVFLPPDYVANLHESPPPDLPARPPVKHPTELLGSRARERGSDPSLPKQNRTNPCPAHRKSPSQQAFCSV